MTTPSSSRPVKLTQAQRDALVEGARPKFGLVSGGGRVCADPRTIRRLDELGLLVPQIRQFREDCSTGWINRAGYAAIGVTPSERQLRHPFKAGEPLP